MNSTIEDRIDINENTLILKTEIVKKNILLSTLLYEKNLDKTIIQTFSSSTDGNNSVEALKMFRTKILSQFFQKLQRYNNNIEKAAQALKKEIKSIDTSIQEPSILRTSKELSTFCKKTIQENDILAISIFTKEDESSFFKKDFLQIENSIKQNIYNAQQYIEKQENNIEHLIGNFKQLSIIIEEYQLFYKKTDTLIIVIATQIGKMGQLVKKTNIIFKTLENYIS